MVKLHFKKADESQFLLDTKLSEETDKVVEDAVHIYNGRLKIVRICYEIEELAKHGTALPPDMVGLTDEQVVELKLVDTWGETCVPIEGFTFVKDPIGRRNGKKPNDHIVDVLEKTKREALDLISKDLVKFDTCLTMKMVSAALDMLRGAIMIAYPMGLPPFDPIRLELENAEDLSGTQASLDVLDVQRTSMWFSGKELKRGKKLEDYLGKNEKSKVIIKLQKSGEGPPGREPVISAEEQKALMMMAYRRQEELKKLEENEDNDYHDSQWADGSDLRRALHGLKNVRIGPK